MISAFVFAGALYQPFPGPPFPNPTLQTSSGSWSGEFTFVFKSEGKAAKNTTTSYWKIDREAKGTITVDQRFKGAGIAGTKDSYDIQRYESWVSTIKRPIQMRIKEEVGIKGPLFSPDEIRRDTSRYTCPPTGEGWQTGKVGSPILQFDRQEGTFTFESPRIFAKTHKYFRREFVSGPPKWMKNPTLINEEDDIEFEMIHELNQPDEWFKIAGSFKPGQTEVVLSRKFPFSAKLGSVILNQKIEGVFTLVLRWIPKT
jgi:hypothetical protein